MVDHRRKLGALCTIHPDHTAGTVAVIVLDAAPTRTRLRVSYDLAALSSDGARWLERFAEGFNDCIAHWQAAINAIKHHAGRTPLR